MKLIKVFVGNLLVVEYLLPVSNKEAVDNQRWNVSTVDLFLYVVQFFGNY